MSESVRPLYLDVEAPASGSIFAWYHAPAGTAAHAAVLCPPIGSELMCSYRALRQLAIDLAAAGIAVLRLDYHGTGDSAGHDEDPDRVASWLASIDRALAEVRRRSGAGSIGLIGVRLGGLLAAICASRRDDVDQLVLWGACRTGKAYVREMRMLRASEAKHAATETIIDGGGTTEEAGGFALTGPTIEALSALDLTALQRAPARRVLVLARDDMPADGRLIEAMTRTGADVTAERWAGFAPMMLAPHYSVAPRALFAQLAGWLTGRPVGAPAGAPADPSFAGEPTADFLEGDAIVRERAVSIGERPGLFAILSEPASSAPRRRTALLLANTGANHHVGPNRMYVKMARTCAARGFPVLRMDLAGIGDSPARDGGPVNKPYAPDGIRDLELGMVALRERTGADRVAVLGLCSGAWAAFQACLAGLPLAGQILVNPQTFYWHEGDSLDVAPGVTYEKVQHYRQSALRWESWKKALTGKIQYRALARLLARRARDVAKTRAQRLARELGVWRPAEDVGRDLRTISDGGVRTLIVFSEGDPGIDYLRRHGDRDVRRLIRRSNFRIEYVADADHTFTSQDSQRRLGAVLAAHLERDFP